MPEPLAQAVVAEAPTAEAVPTTTATAAPVAPTTAAPAELHPVEEQEHQIVVDEVSISARMEAKGARDIRETLTPLCQNAPSWPHLARALSRASRSLLTIVVARSARRLR